MTSRRNMDEPTTDLTPADVLGSDGQSANWEFSTRAPGPSGRLPFTEEFLVNDASGYHFAMSQNAGMGWNPAELLRKQFAILSTVGGVREPDGTPIALGLHIGHFELIRLVEEAAKEMRELNAVPFAMFCTDPCDGRSMGTPGMLDSLPYRNDAAQVFRRLTRSMPTARGVMGIASCDKGLPAMMMALAGMGDLPCVLVPGGVTLPPREGEDAGAVQTIGARFSHGLISLDEASALGCRACGTPGGGCQFLGTAATSQVVGEALGLAPMHSALAPSGSEVWRKIAVDAVDAPEGVRRSATRRSRLFDKSDAPALRRCARHRRHVRAAPDPRPGHRDSARGDPCLGVDQGAQRVERLDRGLCLRRLGRCISRHSWRVLSGHGDSDTSNGRVPRMVRTRVQRQPVR